MPWFAVLMMGVLAQGGQGAAPDAGSDPEHAFRDVAPAVEQLDPLMQRFDTDHDHVLSPQEQEAMAAFVAERRGQEWAERLKRFLRAADTSHDGKVDASEWTHAIAQVRQLATAGADPPKVPDVPSTFSGASQRPRRQAGTPRMKLGA